MLVTSDVGITNSALRASLFFITLHRTRAREIIVYYFNFYSAILYLPSSLAFRPCKAWEFSPSWVSTFLYIQSVLVFP